MHLGVCFVRRGRRLFQIAFAGWGGGVCIWVSVLRGVIGSFLRLGSKGMEVADVSGR